ncbi:bifunctional methylenetetrahydrofolate dehydrogenase/methenyltetrahydrofolate cyclohydrolase FolD [Arenicella xantha]|uniref:Bifunctional protein FolD n=1 Tax=Arenicella xantha TaxID=644221 RepID=A0A395JIA8_9GAMM|nr:bifunctional methylenetetrahydrofolate dehydrogenase/methenyltetrahydrofolate cyclohydrolase FolD [Arenicella xantha]RBP48677.1 methenyltetrahydrofolate cyclohydrolase /5,10-methylenetetrahydrofolate dehydrogenase (NADP+) [Arenicella xantha]
MTAKIIDGKKIAEEIRQEAKLEVAELVKQGIQPCLVVILVGENPASKAYVGSKVRACQETGIKSLKIEMASNASEAELMDEIDRLNADDTVHGILVQLPLPHHMDEERVTERISPAKDVDGFHPENVGKLSIGIDCLTPCTPSGIPELITRSGISMSGKHAVVIGRSNIVGKPMMNILVQKGAKANCTVTCCHSGTDHLANYTRQADILIAAIGVPEFVTSEMVKEGATVIDVGINRVEDPAHSRGYRLVGDVDFDDVKDTAGAITPVPGGVGPMTVAMLMKNTAKAARLIHNH